ncbi:hypothetical protein NN3_31710 [Nocardia neocaledoniensis NBRC 108232]|uniref:hypothetical protein n=1 Tax=Nocardia neocaledoniensis TaxID=236511 RepID=UPI001197F9BC|nr:hypothetical protein [Nocardia neocaledoniensis]GEM32164.1 hypothetical protein NN3_31710 [Nocardia neocaledoniensis NBRC 108232]
MTVYTAAFHDAAGRPRRMAIAPQNIPPTAWTRRCPAARLRNSVSAAATSDLARTCFLVDLAEGTEQRWDFDDNQ